MRKDLGLGLGLLAVGIFMLIELSSIKDAGIRAVVGPEIFPGIVAVGMIVVGLCALVKAFRHRPRPKGEEASEGISLSPILVIMAGLFAQTLLLEYIGWILSTSLLFVITSFAFGGRQIVKSSAIALSLTCVVFFVFNYGLGLSLPSGMVFDSLMSRS